MTKQETLMDKATRKREALKAMAGKKGSATLVVELNEAALMFGLPLKEWDSLGETDRQIRLKRVADKIEIEFVPPVKDRRETYDFLLSLLEPARDGTAGRILATGEIPSLAIELLGTDFEFLKANGKMDELDLDSLHRRIKALGQTISGGEIPDAHKAFSTQTL
jgi:hypothetical protein